MTTPTPKELGYTNDPFGTESMMAQIRRLNQEEALKHQQRREEALNKIRLLRRAQKEQQERSREKA